MVENPFIITEKVIPEYFCDRKKKSEELMKLLVNRNNVVLFSQRRMGKTGLIQFCFEQQKIKKDYITIYLDILSTTDLREFTYLLGKEVYQTVKPLGKKMLEKFVTTLKSLSGKIGFDPLTGIPTLNLQLGDISRPEFTLKEIFEYLSGSDKPCILAIDEFQQIVNYPEKGVEALLRAHILQGNNCRFIFSGSERHLLEEMFMSVARPFYQSASYMELREIPEEFYVDFIVNMFRRGEKEITPLRATEIYRKFGGHTFYIQRLCNAIYANTPAGKEIDNEDVEHSLEEVIYSYDTIYRLRLSSLTLRQKELLLAVAREEPVEGISSMEFIKRNSLASASAVQTSLKSLLKQDYIWKIEDKYIIGDKFFSLWIKKTYF